MVIDEHIKYAGFWIRFLAAIIDAIVLSIVYFPIEALFGMLYFGSFELYWLQSNDPTLFMSPFGIWSNLINVIIGAIYFTIMQCSKWQATLGKKVLKLKITDVFGGRISVGKSLLRYFGYFISTIPLLLGYIMIGLNKKKRGLHDFIAKTYVVRNNR